MSKFRCVCPGDYSAIKELVDKYGTHFDPAVRDQVAARYKALKLPIYWAGINSELTPKMGKNGQITAVEISYPLDAVKQYLGYGSMYDPGLRQPSATNKRR
ncbi:MAG TPA: hypothetical protein VI636_03245 [Candidatus Angelobacter sp.]